MLQNTTGVSAKRSLRFLATNSAAGSKTGITASSLDLAYFSRRSRRHSCWYSWSVNRARSRNSEWTITTSLVPDSIAERIPRSHAMVTGVKCRKLYKMRICLGLGWTSASPWFPAPATRRIEPIATLIGNQFGRIVIRRNPLAD